MRSTVLVLILATTFVVAFDFNKAVQAYTATQNAMDAQAATSLFAPNATVYMPFPSSVQGTKQILAAYAGFFAQVKWMNETVSSPLEINTNWVAYMKTLSGEWANGQAFGFPVISWIQYDLNSGLITSFSVIWTTGQ